MSRPVCHPPNPINYIYLIQDDGPNWGCTFPRAPATADAVKRAATRGGATANPSVPESYVFGVKQRKGASVWTGGNGLLEVPLPLLLL